MPNSGRHKDASNDDSLGKSILGSRNSLRFHLLGGARWEDFPCGKQSGRGCGGDIGFAAGLQVSSRGCQGSGASGARGNRGKGFPSVLHPHTYIWTPGTGDTLWGGVCRQGPCCQLTPCLHTYPTHSAAPCAAASSSSQRKEEL